MVQKIKGLLEFGPFVLNTGEQTLRRDGAIVSLTPKTYDVLLLLLSCEGRLLEKSELLQSAWPDSFVDESNLTQQISLIRRALGEEASKPKYIVTVPGRGYRFAATVIARPGTRTSWFSDKTRLKRTVLVGGAIAAVAVSGVLLFRPTARHRTLAVLPFQSLRADPDSQFIGFSLADAVITRLDVMNSLVVRPSYAVEKYRRQSVNIAKAAADLHVDTLLIGSFIREDNNLRVNTQLVDAPTDSILWKDSFDVKFDRLLDAQDRVTREIVRGLDLKLSPVDQRRLNAGRPVNAAAYEYYLRGVDLYSRNEFSLAIGMLLQSSRLDPKFALTWSQLGRARTAKASFDLAGKGEYDAAQEDFRQALALQPDQVDARVYLANLLTDTGKVESAVPLLRGAEKTNPNHAEVHWELGYAYRFAGMLSQSVAECEGARSLDPGVKATTSVLNGYLYLGQYDRFLRSLPDASDSPLILFYRGLGELYKSDLPAAVKHFDAAFSARPTQLQARIGKAISCAKSERPAEGAAMLAEIEQLIVGRGVGDPEAIYKLAQAYTLLGDRDSAARVLRLSVDNGFFCYPYIAADPLTATLRTDSRFVVAVSAARLRHEAFRAKFF